MNEQSLVEGQIDIYPEESINNCVYTAACAKLWKSNQSTMQSTIHLESREHCSQNEGKQARGKKIADHWIGIACGNIVRNLAYLFCDHVDKAFLTFTHSYRQLKQFSKIQNYQE